MLSQLHAAQAAPAVPVQGPAYELGLGALWPMLLVIGLLVAALVAVRLRLGRSRPLVGSVPLEVLGQLALSPGHTLYVVRAGERRLLLGGAPGGLSLIADLADRDARDARPARDDRSARPGQPAADAEPARDAEAVGDWLGAVRGTLPASDRAPLGGRG